MKKYITLNNNHTMPSIGLGTWRSEARKVASAVEFAIQTAGYEHIDCAAIYGNEKAIGKSFNVGLSTKQLDRQHIFVTSKLWNTNHHPDNVERACRQTLSDLQLDYLDLYLVHWGIAFEHGKNPEPVRDGNVKTEAVSLQDTWRAMEQLVEKGLVKSIGVANYTVPMIVDLLSYARIKPVINQVEIHPYHSQEELVEYCQKQGIAVTAYSPLGSGGEGSAKLLSDKVVVGIARFYKKTPAQVLIRWSLQRDLIVIPKSTTHDRILENIQIYDFELSNQDMVAINGLNKNMRFVDPIEWWGIPYFK